MSRHKGEAKPAPYLMLPKHCNGACDLKHDAPFPFDMRRGKLWGRHVVKSTIPRPTELTQ